jgi:hypothetical protein
MRKGLHYTAVLIELCIVSFSGCTRSDEIARRDVARALSEGYDSIPRLNETIVRAQRNLFAGLMAGDVPDSLISPRFTVESRLTLGKNMDHLPLSVTLIRGNERPLRVDRTVLAVAGDLEMFLEYEVLRLEPSKLVVISRRHAPDVTMMTEWRGGGMRWRSTRVVVSPDTSLLSFLRLKAKRNPKS